MQEKQLFEYAVIRIVPMVEREEFMNIGVVLYCASKKYLDVLYELDEARLRAFSGKIDLEELENYMHAFKAICAGQPNSGPVGKLPVAERFRWLTATRSTIVQTSKVHPGLCSDTTAMLGKLYKELVLREE